MKKYILGLFIFLIHGTVCCFSQEERAYEDWLYSEGYVKFSLACGTGGRCLLSDHNMLPSNNTDPNSYVEIPSVLAERIKQQQLMYYNTAFKRQEEANERMNALFEQCCNLKVSLGDDYNYSAEAAFIDQCHNKLLLFKGEIDKCHAFQMPPFFKEKMLVKKVKEDSYLYDYTGTTRVLTSEYAEYFFLFKKYEERLKILKGLSSYLDDCEKRVNTFMNKASLDSVYCDSPDSDHQVLSD